MKILLIRDLDTKNKTKGLAVTENGCTIEPWVNHNLPGREP